MYERSCVLLHHKKMQQVGHHEGSVSHSRCLLPFRRVRILGWVAADRVILVVRKIRRMDQK